MYVRYQRRIQSHIQPTSRVISKHLDIVVTCHRFVVQIVEISRDYKQVYDWSERNSMLKHSHNCRTTHIRTVSMQSAIITYTKPQEHAYTCTPARANIRAIPPPQIHKIHKRHTSCTSQPPVSAQWARTTMRLCNLLQHVCITTQLCHVLRHCFTIRTYNNATLQSLQHICTTTTQHCHILPQCFYNAHV